MRRSLLIVLVFIACNLPARSKAPDSLAVSKLYSTSWTLTEKYAAKKGMFRKWRKLELGSGERVTIYSNEFHTSLADGTYQVCSMRHRNGNELWLDCKIADQYIYRVISIDGDKLVMDVLVRKTGDTEYKRTHRKHYQRKKD